MNRINIYYTCKNAFFVYKTAGGIWKIFVPHHHTRAYTGGRILYKYIFRACIPDGDQPALRHVHRAIVAQPPPPRSWKCQNNK